MASLFSKIIAGDIPSYKVAEDDRYFAFLDIFPIREGHVLVIPRQEVDNLFDLPENVLSGLLVFARPIAKAIEKLFPCNRCGISVIGLEVPHAHIHLVPIDSADDLNFTKQKLKLPPERMLEIQKAIAAELANSAEEQSE